MSVAKALFFMSLWFGFWIFRLQLFFYSYFALAEGNYLQTIEAERLVGRFLLGKVSQVGPAYAGWQVGELARELIRYLHRAGGDALTRRGGPVRRPTLQKTAATETEPGYGWIGAVLSDL